MRAGGFSSNGYLNILQLSFPKDIHQKTSVLLSSKKNFSNLLTYQIVFMKMTLK